MNENLIKGLVNLMMLIVSICLDSFLGGAGNVKPEIFRKVYFYLPTACIVALNLCGFSIVDALKWVYMNTDNYVLIIVLLVLSEPIGGLIDAAIGLYEFRLRNGKIKLTNQQKYRVIKFGDDQELIRGAGRYDLSLPKICYGIMSNLTGAVCPLAILLLIKSLPNYLSFLDNTKWIEFLDICGALMVIPGIQQINAQQSKPYPDSVLNRLSVNPDNYLLNRFHVVGSLIVLWCTTVMVALLCISFFVYGIANFQRYELSISFVYPIAALTCYLFYQSVSKVSFTYQAVNSTAYKRGQIAILLIVFFSIILFRFSITTVEVIGISMFLVFLWKFMIKRIDIKSQNDERWNERTKWINYLIYIACCVVISMVIIQAFNMKLQT